MSTHHERLDYAPVTDGLRARLPLRSETAADHLFHVSVPTADDGWCWSIRGASTQAFGPYPSREAALGHRWALCSAGEHRPFAAVATSCC